MQVSVRSFVRPSPLMGTYWVGYLLSTCSLFRIGVHRTTQLILIYCWVFCLLLGRNFVWEKPNKNITVRTSVRPSIRQHLTWVSCERNSSYSFAPIVLKLCMCFPHGMRMCMWTGRNCWISFCHFFDIVNLVIFHPDYIDRGYLL